MLGAGDQGETEVTAAGETEAMVVCMLILLNLFIFFCLLPVYKLLKKRWNHWNQVVIMLYEIRRMITRLMLSG